MAEYNFSFDWARVTTIGKVKVLAEQVIGAPGQDAINAAVAAYIEAHPGALSPLSAATKAALLQIAEKVAYIDENGESYYNALEAALTAKELLSITAVYTQTGTVYDTDTLDSLKADLVVTAYYDDGTTADVTSAATLSGTLTEGTSTITATYEEKTATFNVTVTLNPVVDFGNFVVGTFDTSGSLVGTGLAYKGVSANNRAVTSPFAFPLENGFTYTVHTSNTSYLFNRVVVTGITVNTHAVDYAITSGVNKLIIAGTLDTDYSILGSGYITTDSTYTCESDNEVLIVALKKSNNGNFSASDLSTAKTAISVTRTRTA